MMSSHKHAPNRSSSRTNVDDADNDVVSDNSLDTTIPVKGEGNGATGSANLDAAGRRIKRQQRPRAHRDSNPPKISPHGHHSTHRYGSSPSPSPQNNTETGMSRETTETEDDFFSVEAQMARSLAATGRRNAISGPSSSRVPGRSSRPYVQQGRRNAISGPSSSSGGDVSAGRRSSRPYVQQGRQTQKDMTLPFRSRNGGDGASTEEIGGILNQVPFYDDDDEPIS